MERRTWELAAQARAAWKPTRREQRPAAMVLLAWEVCGKREAIHQPGAPWAAAVLPPQGALGRRGAIQRPGDRPGPVVRLPRGAHRQRAELQRRVELPRRAGCWQPEAIRRRVARQAQAVHRRLPAPAYRTLGSAGTWRQRGKPAHTLAPVTAAHPRSPQVMWERRLRGGVAPNAPPFCRCWGWWVRSRV